MSIVVVAGARPNFMKVQPVLRALGERDETAVLVHTGQHYDPAMSDIFFDELGIAPPDHHLEVGSGTHAVQTAKVMMAFEALLKRLQPDAVVVAGDVNSTFACAVVGAKAGCLVGHIEAGLRSRDWSMPEEVNRVVTDRVSDYLFAPSSDAVENLESEGYRGDQIHLVGNVMVDTLLANLDRARERPVLQELGLEPGEYGLITMHRPANVDDPDILEALLGALETVAGEVALVFPVHPRARAKIEARAGSGPIRLIEPRGYLDFLALQASARLVLTDSGGIQEETTVLGVPCLTLRENTERPITVDQGTNQVVGRDPVRVVAAAREVLAKGVEPRRPPLWDGKAGERIAGVLLDALGQSDHPRPTSLLMQPGRARTPFRIG